MQSIQKMRKLFYKTVDIFIMKQKNTRKSRKFNFNFLTFNKINNSCCFTYTRDHCQFGLRIK